ncbi:MAG: hypothetical protein JJU27_14000 [Gammaproteobacteria bacterium]|nr:hypothetical protein [Gammaproteobacteria bacterium]
MSRKSAAAIQATDGPGEPELQLVRTWLQRIGEDDPAVIADVLEKAQTDPVALAYFIERERLSRTNPPREQVLDMLQASPEARIAYLVTEPDQDLVPLVIAIRGTGTARLTVPVDRYDAAALLDFIRERAIT